MGTLSHCLPVDRTPFWAQLSVSLWVSWEYLSAVTGYGICHCSVTCHRDNLLDGTCRATGTSLSTDTAQQKLHHENVSFLPWWLHLGGSAGIFVEWGGTAAVLSSSGKGQHGRLSFHQLWRAGGAGHGHCSLGAALGARTQLSEKLQDARGCDTLTAWFYSHTVTLLDSQVSTVFFSLLSPSLFSWCLTTPSAIFAELNNIPSCLIFTRMNSREFFSLLLYKRLSISWIFLVSVLCSSYSMR